MHVGRDKHRQERLLTADHKGKISMDEPSIFFFKAFWGGKQLVPGGIR